MYAVCNSMVPKKYVMLDKHVISMQGKTQILCTAIYRITCKLNQDK